MMQTIEIDEKCKSCKGTGLYIGFAEKGGAAVVCQTCNGTGCHHFRYDYEEFTHREERRNIVRVFEANPGIGIGEGNGYKLEDFGGMPYKEWLLGLPFPSGSEMRKYTCPSWWYQVADYEKKPLWDECEEALGRSFSACSHFYTKELCWMKWDSENKGEASGR